MHRCPFLWIPLLLAGSAAFAQSADDYGRELEQELAAPEPSAEPSARPSMTDDVPPPKAPLKPVETADEQRERLFEEALSAVRAQIDRRDPEALAGAKKLAREAKAVGPLALEDAAEAIFLAATGESRAQVARAWLLSCGTEPCRDRALAALASTGSAGKAAAQKERAADACVSHPTGSCLSSAAATYRGDGDTLMLLRAELARDPDGALEPWKRVPDACREPRCALLVAEAHERIARDLLERAGDAAAEDVRRAHGAEDSTLQSVSHALTAVRLRQQASRASERLYARTDVLDDACAAFEEARGAGACRKLEQKVLGGPVFHDPSRGATLMDGLPPEMLRSVHAEFGPLLTPCLQAEARRRSGAVQVSWVVLNDGRVADLSVRQQPASSPLSSCLRGQLARWRYPKYRGEWQHVEQEFRLTAH